MNLHKYRVVLVGCGGMSGGWLSAIRDHFPNRAEVVGFCDISLENARKRAEEFGAPGSLVETSLESALKTLRPDILFNCTIPEAHTATCQTALEAGCHVLVEKPLAPTVAEGKQMVAAASRTGKCLAVIQNRRYTPEIITVRTALAGGAIGKVHTLCADFFLAPRFGGFRDAMQHPLLLDMAIHTFDEARFLGGLNAKEVFCHEFNPTGSWYAQGASAMAIFKLEQKVVFNYRGSWCAQGLPTSWESSWRFIGDEGTLLWDGGRQIVHESVTKSWDKQGSTPPMIQTTLPSIEMPPSTTGHAGNIGAFLNALDQGVAPQTVASDNILSLAMVEAAVTSAETRRFVSL